jgi:hypothetical protein
MILRYPITNLFGRTFSLQQNFFGLELYEQEVGCCDFNTYSSTFKDHDKAEQLLRKHVKDDGNDTSIPTEVLQQHVSNMKMVKMVCGGFLKEFYLALFQVVMQLRAEHDPTWKDTQVKEYEMAMVKRFQE